MKVFYICLGMILLSLPCSTENRTKQHASSVKSNESHTVGARALQKLVEGNNRFSSHHMRHPHETIQRRMRLAREGQHPFAIVLSCSDSRVPPEIVFDEGLGDLFVVRIAGNIVDDAVIGSIEYATEHLGAKLLLVLGHEKCGAINAAIENQHEAHLQSLVDAIRPAVEQVQKNDENPNHLGKLSSFADKVARENIRHVVSTLEESKPVLAKLVSEQKLKIVGGYYHLANGKVEFFHENKLVR
jgi:carbonic anhydrase